MDLVGQTPLLHFTITVNSNLLLCLKKNFHDIVKTFNDSNSTANEITKTGEKHNLHLYRSYKDIQSLNELRYYICFQKVSQYKKS